jgi:hypothetical protein
MGRFGDKFTGEITVANDSTKIIEDRDRFMMVIGSSIQAYANLEHALCQMLANCGDMKVEVAAIIFFKITASRVRDSILEKLIRMKYGTGYSIFWNSFAKRLDEVSLKRNEVVHWSAIITLDANTHEHILVPPAYLATSPIGTEIRITENDLKDFSDKCGFLTTLAYTFINELNASLIPGLPQAAWRDIFQQPAIYPPPSTHPLYRSPSIPGTPPLPSPGSQGQPPRS